VESHAEFLRRVTLDEQLAQSVKKNYQDADLANREKAMLDYVAKLTRAPKSIEQSDLETLRQHGFTDEAILQVNLIASWFNYINRVADGLGVGRSSAVSANCAEVTT
jgi:uncharacterized peroxidase-related enzyme